MANYILILVAIFSACVTICQAQCGDIYENEVSAADKTVIISTHNSLRTLISAGEVPGQPKGTNLRTMQWDNKLGEAAQNIANTCVFEHVSVDDDRFYVGQNLAAFSSTNYRVGPDWQNTIEHQWFDEYKDFTYPNISRGVTGHYTQVVWADTYLVGCGYISYQKDANSWYDKFYVCNYGPGGNWVGEAPYEI